MYNVIMSTFNFLKLVVFIFTFFLHNTPAFFIS